MPTTETPETTPNLEAASTALETAAEAVQEGNPEAASTALETAREELTQEAETLSEQTEIPPAIAERLAHLDLLTARLEALEMAVYQSELSQEVAEEVTEEEPQADAETVQILADVIQETAPAQAALSRLKNGYSSPYKSQTW